MFLDIIFKVRLDVAKLTFESNHFLMSNKFVFVEIVNVCRRVITLITFLTSRLSIVACIHCGIINEAEERSEDMLTGEMVLQFSFRTELETAITAGQWPEYEIFILLLDEIEIIHGGVLCWSEY